MGPGTWSIGKSIGIGCGLALALRLALGIGVSIWPQIFRSAGAGLQPATTELCGELLGRYGLVGLIGAAAVFTPVLEEMLFRGVLLQAFAKHLPFAWANAVQAALFAALHETLVLSPFFFAFACINGVLARRAGGLLPAILLHALNNLVVCLVLAAARHTGH
jgi:membrane protease YdiL (CAAX protease family)